MKKIVSVVLTVLLLATSAAALASGEITAVGKGSVSVLPNVATLSVGVTQTDMDIATAMTTVNEKLDAIRQAVTALGVQADDIVVGNINYYSQYDYSETPERLVGFNVSHTLDIRTQDLDSLGQLIDAAVAAGANQMNGVSFSLDDEGTSYKKALALAVENAKVRASVMAQAAQLTLGDIEEIVENGDTYWGENAFASKTAEMGGAGDAATQVDYGDMQISANIIVKFNVND